LAAWIEVEKSLLTNDMKNTPLHNLFVFVVLAAALALPAIMLDKFQEYGPELLQNPSFNGGGEGWIVQDTPTSNIKIEDGILGILSTGSSNSPTVYQEILPDPDLPLLRLQGDLRVEDVILGTKSWYTAKLLFVQYENGKGQSQIPHVVKTLEGTHSWQHYQSEFTISPPNRLPTGSHTDN
jgi:hypothetical protein